MAERSDNFCKRQCFTFLSEILNDSKQEAKLFSSWQIDMTVDATDFWGKHFVFHCSLISCKSMKMNLNQM